MSRKSKKPNQDIPLWAKTGHGKPVTRREFLASGLIPFTAWAVAPSLSTFLIPSEASAAGALNCLTSTGPGMIPFITLNLQGGASLASQVVLKNLAGGPLRSYTLVGQGLGPVNSWRVEKEFGDVEFAGPINSTPAVMVSKFLTGVRMPRTNAPRPTALDKTAFVWQPVSLGDDSAMNPIDISGLVIKMGLTGAKLPNLGTDNTATGIAQMPTLVPPPAPFQVRQVTDLANALGYSSALKGLSSAQKGSLAKLIANLSSGQVRRIASMPGGQVVSEMMACAGVRNIDLISSNGGDVNPFTVATIKDKLAAIWGVNVNTPTGRDAVFGAMVYNGIAGNAATVNLNMGGYDYHDGTRTRGDAADLAAGQVVGKILETAELLQRPVFIYVCSDGSATTADSADPTSPWMSDRGIAGMQFMLAYHPSGRPQTSSSQIGGFNDGQAADGKFLTGNSPELAAQAVFTNYASLNGRLDFAEANRIMSDANNRAQVIRFQKVG